MHGLKVPDKVFVRQANLTAFLSRQVVIQVTTLLNVSVMHILC